MKASEFPKTLPRLETDRLILREIMQDDRHGILGNFSDKDVAKWFFEEPYSEIEQADEIIQAFINEFEQGKGLTWAITLKRSNEFVGTCGYGEIEIGSWWMSGTILITLHCSRRIEALQSPEGESWRITQPPPNVAALPTSSRSHRRWAASAGRCGRFPTDSHRSWSASGA